MNTRLLEGSVKDGGLAALVRLKSGVQIELEALCERIFELKRGFENVGGGPGLRVGQTVRLVGILGLYVSGNEARLVVLVAGDLEDDARGCLCLHLERGVGEREILAQKIGGGLSEIL